MLQRTIPSVTPDSTGIEIAAAVLEDLKDPNRWCVNVTDNRRGQRCLIGSAFLVTGFSTLWDYGDPGPQAVVARRLAEAMGFRDEVYMADFNNTAGHAAVIQRLKDTVGVE